MLLPIVSLSNFISFLAYFSVTILTYFSYQKRKIEFTLNFLRAFIFLTIFFLLISANGFICKTPISNGLIALASYIWIYTMMASFIVILIRIGGWRRMGGIILFFLLLGLLFTIVLGISDFRPSNLVLQGGFIYWVPGVNPLIRLLIGLVSLVSGIIFIVLTIYNGIKSREKKVFLRSLLIGGGMATLISASAINYIGGAVASPFTLIVSSIFTIVSAFLFLGGIIYKIEEQYGKSI